MFSFFKKDKKPQDQRPDYDPTNIKVTDLRKGFVLDYDLKTWEVAEEYEYDWGAEYFTYEYKLVSPEKTVFLSVEDDDELICTVCTKINFGKLGDDVEDSLMSDNRPPRKVIYEGVTYYRESERPGYFKNIQDESDSAEFIAWEYYDDSEKKILSIEQWGDAEFEAATGIVVPARAFTNILPGA